MADPRAELMARLPDGCQVNDLRPNVITVIYDPACASHTDVESALQKLSWQPVRSRWSQFLCQWREENQREQTEQMPGWGTAVYYARVACRQPQGRTTPQSTTNPHRWQRHVSRRSAATDNAVADDQEIHAPRT